MINVIESEVSTLQIIKKNITGQNPKLVPATPILITPLPKI